jgi:hypothetical protein
MQNGLLRKQELLRHLKEKHEAGLATARQTRLRKPTTGRHRDSFRGSGPLHFPRGVSSASARNRFSSRAFAASPDDDLYSIDLIQRA